MYSVRGNGGHLGALRTCSATRSVLTAFERASKHAHAVHVIDIVDNAAVVDIPMLSAEPWFHDLCSYCLADKKASADSKKPSMVFPCVLDPKNILKLKNKKKLPNMLQ